MKLINESFTETDGVEDSEMSEMTIKATGKGFSLLIDKLYSEKIDSVVREICSNAFDAHKSAGRPDVPFDIILPTRIEPTLCIRDCGIGLPVERVKKLFGTVFESTKEQSNTDIGAFGLGSKSPYAITDSYTIESRFNGTKSTILASKKNGVPFLMVTMEEPTDDVNGITVCIPIHDSDIYNVTRAVTRQLYFFPTKPTIGGKPANLWSEDKQVHLYGESYLITTTAWNGHRVRMGPVSYPLDLEQIKPELKDKLIRIAGKNSYGYSSSGKLVITEFPMGTLDLQPNREGLSYIDETKDALNEYFEKMVVDYEKKFLDEFNLKSTSIYAANLWLEEQRNQNPYLTSMSFDFGGMSVDGMSSAFLHKFAKYDQAECVMRPVSTTVNLADQFDEFGDRKEDWKPEVVITHEEHKWTSKHHAFGSKEMQRYSTSWSRAWRENTLSYLSVRDITTILSGDSKHNGAIKLVWIDDDQAIAPKVKYAQEQSPSMMRFFWGSASLRDKTLTSLDALCDIIASVCDESAADIKARFVLSSSLPKPPPKVRDKVERLKAEGNLYGVFLASKTDLNSRNIPHVSDLRLRSGDPYIVTNRGKYDGDEHKSGYVKRLVALGQPVVSVAISAAKDLRKVKEAGLIPLEQWIKTTVESRLNEVFFARLWATCQENAVFTTLPEMMKGSNNKVLLDYANKTQEIGRKFADHEEFYPKFLQIYDSLAVDPIIVDNLGSLTKLARSARREIQELNQLKRVSRAIQRDPLVMTMSKLSYHELHCFTDEEKQSVVKYLNNHFVA